MNQYWTKNHSISNVVKQIVAALVEMKRLKRKKSKQNLKLRRQRTNQWCDFVLTKYLRKKNVNKLKQKNMKMMLCCFAVNSL